MFRRILIAAGLLLLVVIGAFAAVIAFNAPTAPPVLAAGNSIPGIAQWNFAELPKPQTLKARDGAPLNYRLYPGRPDRAVVLVHGSSGTDVSMLKLAQALQAAGATVYAISLRGHGGSGTANGDVSYIGQLDDDLADLVKGLGLDKPGDASHAHRLFLRRRLRVAHRRRQAGRPVQRLSRDLALHRPGRADQQAERRRLGRRGGAAHHRAVAARRASACRGSRTCPPSTSPPTPRPSNSRTPVYSFRLAASLQLGRDWRGVLSRISAPTEIVVGANDELFNADQFKPMLQPINPRIGVTIVPNETHLGMIADPPATAAIAAAWRKLAGD